MTTLLFFFLFLFLFLYAISITLIASTFNSPFTLAELKVERGILHITITTLNPVTHLNVITIIDRWWWLSSWPQIVCARTGGCSSITTPSFLYFLRTDTP
jgi:hypothetical protein